MYINVGMANREKRPNKNGMTYASHTLLSLHLFPFFCNIEVCVLLEHDFVHRWCAGGVGSKLLRGGSPVKACVG